MRRDKALSTEVGIAIILTIVAIATGMILSGSKVLSESIISSNHMSEMRSSYVLLKSNLDKVVFDSFPSRNTQITIYEGTFYLQRSGNVSLRNTTIPLYSFVYEKDDVRIVLENDAVFTYYGDRFVLDYAPRVLKAGDTVLFPVIEFSSFESIGGKAKVIIGFENLGGGVFEANNVTIESVNADAWESILKEVGVNYTRVGDRIFLNESKILVKYSLVSLEILSG
ncbi:hypothetical protein Ferp_0922 [Ferroglobus placidus DSM 10642]|uniref:Flagellin n=1 Tax=Ferroglobus placidus (strain DSM 10642 / AEDII12DO) TaxID=589924 RepID=D3RX75_FERPA|nr:hypothetical protein [Ferroglobus placidus]ADC65088.1 hypothetical protein Ferp_0922 [Ferroglobus placidus DSM 10642]